MMRRFSKKDVALMQAGKLPAPTEEDVQRVIIDGLKLHGYRVLVTGKRRRKCPKCGSVSRRGDGCSKGVPDLLVRSESWLSGFWKGIEIKKAGTVRYSSPEQKVLAECGSIIVVQSLDEALVAVGCQL